eukprot:16431490-Heterocapsa_arctica.AAC.1
MASFLRHVVAQDADEVVVVARDFPDEQPAFIAAAVRARLVVDGSWSEGVLEEAGVSVRCHGQGVLDDTVESCLRMLK